MEPAEPLLSRGPIFLFNQCQILGCGLLKCGELYRRGNVAELQLDASATFLIFSKNPFKTQNVGNNVAPATAPDGCSWR